MTNKRAKEVARTDRKQECRWCLEMDEWNGKRMSVQTQISTNDIESLEEGVITFTLTSNQGILIPTTATSFTQEERKKPEENILNTI